MLGIHCVNTLGELTGLLEIGQLALHPYHIAVRSVGDSTRDAGFATALETVVSLSCAGGIPIEPDIDASEPLCDGAGFEVRFVLRLSQKVGDELGLVDVDACVDGVDDGVFEELETGLGEPVVFDLLEFFAEFAGLFRGDHEVVEGLEGGVRAAEDVLVVAGVDG